MPNNDCQNMLFWLQAGTEQEALSPPGEKKKSIFSSPRAICKRPNSMAGPPEEEGDSARVTFSPRGPYPRVGGQPGGGAGLGAEGGLGAEWQPPGRDLPPARLAAPGRACQITANTSRPASTGIPNRDKSGAPGGSWMEPISMRYITAN